MIFVGRLCSQRFHRIGGNTIWLACSIISPHCKLQTARSNSQCWPWSSGMFVIRQRHTSVQVLIVLGGIVSLQSVVFAVTESDTACRLFPLLLGVGISTLLVVLAGKTLRSISIYGHLLPQRCVSSLCFRF